MYECSALEDKKQAEQRAAEARRSREGAYAQQFAEAYKAYDAKDFKGAIRTLDRMLSAGHGDPRPFYLKGRCFFELERYDEALANFDKSFDQSDWCLLSGNGSRLNEKEAVLVRFFLGRTHRAKGDFIQAERCFDEVLRAKPSHKSAYFYRACCRMDRKRYKKAM
jgi:tetratricopeptide (TPR) repeat protein